MTYTSEKNLKTLTGTVVSAKMTGTVVVNVEWMKPHPKYKKRVKVSNRHKAALCGHTVKIGDRVSIKSTRPKSKTVSFAVVSVDSVTK